MALTAAKGGLSPPFSGTNASPGPLRMVALSIPPSARGAGYFFLSPNAFIVTEIRQKRRISIRNASLSEGMAGNGPRHGDIKGLDIADVDAEILVGHGKDLGADSARLIA